MTKIRLNRWVSSAWLSNIFRGICTPGDGLYKREVLYKNRPSGCLLAEPIGCQLGVEADATGDAIRGNAPLGYELIDLFGRKMNEFGEFADRQGFPSTFNLRRQIECFNRGFHSGAFPSSSLRFVTVECRYQQEGGTCDFTKRITFQIISPGISPW